MARKVENKKDFLVIEITWEEAQQLGFGIPEGCICMKCNNIIDHNKIYYVAVLNDTMCEDCFNKWLETAKNYPEDREIEAKNFNYYCTKLWM